MNYLYSLILMNNKSIQIILMEMILVNNYKNPIILILNVNLILKHFFKRYQLILLKGMDIF